MGRLIPTSCYEVLPGDSVQQGVSALVRVSPLVSPVMHPVQVRFHTFYVPNRILWPGWEDFITGGPDGDNSNTPPFINGDVAEGSIADYLGVPPGTGRSFQSAPVQAVAKIFNEYYRDQDLVNEIDLDTVDGNTMPPAIAWEKDYFTSARPWTQKGPEITLPLGGTAPIIGNGNPWHMAKNPNGNQPVVQTLITGTGAFQVDDTSSPIYWGGAGPDYDSGAIADLTEATAASVNDVRRAFALQRYEEARAQYGSRYTEYLRYLGVTSSDARLQRPEYLGGGKQTISFSEVLGTYDGGAEGGTLGQLGGHGIAAIRSRPFRRFFEEHGFVITLMSVRPKTMYANSMHRMFTRRDKEDYYQKELETIGQQEIYNSEVYADASDPNAVFGYQDRYAEYKRVPSTVKSEFRNLLDYWHLARKFPEEPVLNGTFVSCNPSERIFADQTETQKLWCMVNHNVVARSMVRKNVKARII